MDLAWLSIRFYFFEDPLHPMQGSGKVVALLQQ